MTSLQLAGIFHDTYERLAPNFDYQTRPVTRIFKPTSPNGKLMLAVCKEILERFDIIDKCRRRCQHCGSTRPFYVPYPTYHDALCGTLEICLDCGMVQGQWPYPKENA